MNAFLRFCYAFSAVFVTAVASSYFVESGLQLFYHRLILPPLTPPDAVFAPVWSILYVLMIGSFYRILNGKDITEVQSATALFLGQLVLNVLWCYLFFYKISFGWALICLLLMIWTWIAMLIKFFSIDPWSARWQYPGLVWLFYATYLNAGVLWLNADFHL